MLKGEAMAKIVPIRFMPEDIKAIAAAAKASDPNGFPVDTEHAECRSGGLI